MKKMSRQRALYTVGFMLFCGGVSLNLPTASTPYGAQALGTTIGGSLSGDTGGNGAQESTGGSDSTMLGTTAQGGLSSTSLCTPVVSTGAVSTGVGSTTVGGTAAGLTTGGGTSGAAGSGCGTAAHKTVLTPSTMGTGTAADATRCAADIAANATTWSDPFQTSSPYDICELGIGYTHIAVNGSSGKWGYNDTTHKSCIAQSEACTRNNKWCNGPATCTTATGVATGAGSTHAADPASPASPASPVPPVNPFLPPVVPGTTGS